VTFVAVPQVSSGIRCDFCCSPLDLFPEHAVTLVAVPQVSSPAHAVTLVAVPQASSRNRL
jgi:hypothetical protein